MSVTKQKDYLKKYLSIGKDSTEKKKKKKKIKSNIAASRLVIIDDNADTFENAVKEDLLEDEDAPQIVAVIDDRPPSLRVDEKNNTHLWIPIGGNTENSRESSSNSFTRSQNLEDLSPPRKRDKPFARKNENEDMSPPRRKIPSLKKYSDKSNDNERIEMKEINEDISPPRKDSSMLSKTTNKKKSSRWESKDLDVSSPRHTIVKKSDKHENEKYDDDNSPPRERSLAALPKMLNKEISIKWKSDEKINNGKYDDDMSPPRKKSKDTLPEIANKRKSSRWESENDNVPSTRHNECKIGDKHEGENLKKKYNDEDISPRRKRSGTTPTKIMKTLDGKTAGLQNAKQLAAETLLFKEKERKLFDQMSSEISGANATTIVRDKKTGKVRDPQEEAARELEKNKKEDINKEKYSRWGRGLKQVEDATKRRDEELNEMSKPLARYANDEDLERYLKEQEREGDPMLAYIRKKKKKKDVDEGKPIKPEYMGEFMPNRFGIRPGHRWDGVDRSNGYEKKWFDIQNSRLAQQEEAYKWGIEDM